MSEDEARAGTHYCKLKLCMDSLLVLQGRVGAHKIDVVLNTIIMFATNFLRHIIDKKLLKLVHNSQRCCKNKTVVVFFSVRCSSL